MLKIAVWKSGGSLVIKIPRAIADMLNIQHHDNLLVTVAGDQIILKKVVQ